MTLSQAKALTLSRHKEWLQNTFGMGAETVEQLSDGRVMVTINVSHLPPEEQNRVIQNWQKALRAVYFEPPANAVCFV
jgi:hypothetical protein